MRFVGIDPGLLGSIALISDGVLCRIHNMPTSKTGVGSRREVNRKLLKRLLLELGPDFVALEEQRPFPQFVKDGRTVKLGVGTAFKMGDGYGAVKGVLDCLDLSWAEIPPKTWQKEYGITTGGIKAKAALVAARFWPDWTFERQDHVDAALIAEYGRRHVGVESA